MASQPPERERSAAVCTKLQAYRQRDGTSRKRERRIQSVTDKCVSVQPFASREPRAGLRMKSVDTRRNRFPAPSMRECGTRHLQRINYPRLPGDREPHRGAPGAICLRRAQLDRAPVGCGFESRRGIRPRRAQLDRAPVGCRFESCHRRNPRAMRGAVRTARYHC